MFGNDANNGYGNNNGYSNGGFRSINVNTKLYASFDDNSLLTINGWNNNISLKFHPVKAVNADGSKVYAQQLNEVVNVTITPDTSPAIIDGIENVILPAIKSGKDDSVAFTTGNENQKRVLVIYTKEKGTEVWISASYNITEDFKENPSAIIEHKLNTRKYRKKFDRTTGEGDEIEVQAGILHLLDKLKHIEDLSPNIGHGVIYTNKVKDFARQNGNNGAPNYNQINVPYTANENNIASSEMSEFLPFN